MVRKSDNRNFQNRQPLGTGVESSKREKVMKNSIGFVFLALALLMASLGCAILSTPDMPTEIPPPIIPPTFTAEPVATATFIPSLTPFPKEEGISGIYILKGTNFNGSEYTGEVKISKSGDSYVIVWRIGDQQTQTGAGTFDGIKLTARWQEGKNSGDVIYTLQADGSLSGVWTIDGSSGQGTELLIPK